MPRDLTAAERDHDRDEPGAATHEQCGPRAHQHRHRPEHRRVVGEHAACPDVGEDAERRGEQADDERACARCRRSCHGATVGAASEGVGAFTSSARTQCATSHAAWCATVGSSRGIEM